jgi:hypothetical protein
MTLARLLQRGGVVLVIAIFAVAIGSAQAAPSTKSYTANVHAINAAVTQNTFRVTLTNDPQSNQTLGSINVTPPDGFVLGTASTTRTGWSANVVGNVLQFRSTSNPVAKGDSVVADVTVTSPTLPTSCADATWTPAAKQSNDFSGSGNDFTLKTAGTDLIPLGRFDFADIETVQSGLHIPQIFVGAAKTVAITARDTCGHIDTDYSGASLSAAPNTPARLVGTGVFSSLTFLNGSGSGTVTPPDVEAADQVVVSDSVSGINKSSNSFDVVETICAVPGTVCNWQNKNKSISATSTVPGDSGGTASLGFGFRALTAACGTGSLVGEGVDISPHLYENAYRVTLTYAKSLTGNGPASGFHFCISDDTLTWTPLDPCSATLTVGCVFSQKRVTGGALEFVLVLSPTDPWGGGFG